MYRAWLDLLAGVLGRVFREGAAHTHGGGVVIAIGISAPTCVTCFGRVVLACVMCGPLRRFVMACMLCVLQSEIEAEHASTRIQQRETRGTFRMVNPRQRKQVRNNNPQRADNQRPTAHTQ
jgi:hypothetical protein